MPKAEKISQVLAAHKQGHILAYFNQLDLKERGSLLGQAAAIDLEELTFLINTLVKTEPTPSSATADLAPAPYIQLPRNGGDPEKWQEAFDLGEEALRAGNVAVVTVAGGQGTRLGFDGPKGTFAVTPVQKKSLFQVFSEKIQSAEMRYNCTIPWFIMTSAINHAATVRFFKQNAYFNRDPDQTHFFSQGLMPAVNNAGKILLEGPSRIALSPDGHGGVFRALVRQGAVEKMNHSGIDLISYFQVDNPLAACIDPAFLGFHLKADSEMSSKMVPRIDPTEKVGLFCLQNDRLTVVEYSNIPKGYAEQRDASGHLRYRVANIAMHILSSDFIQRIGSSGARAFPFHRAEKNIQALDPEGDSLTPVSTKGIKFELFIFDALPFARNPIVIETDRASEFSPVKNAKGQDSPKTCIEAQLRQFYRWAQAAGLSLPLNEKGVPDIAIEVSPLFATDEATFVQKWNNLKQKPTLKDGVYLGAEGG